MTSLYDQLKKKQTSSTQVTSGGLYDKLKSSPITPESKPIVTPEIQQKVDSIVPPKKEKISFGQAVSSIDNLLGSGLKQGAVIIGKGLNEYNKFFYNTFSGKNSNFAKEYEKDSEKYKMVLDDYSQRVQDKLVSRVGDRVANSIYGQMVQGVGQLGAQLPAFAISPWAGIAVIGAQSIGLGKEQYDSVLERTGDKKIATINGLAVGLATGLEALPWGRAFGIVKKSLQKPVTKGFLDISKRIGKTALLESATEGGQQLVQDVTEMLTFNEDMTMGQALKNAVTASLIALPAGAVGGGVAESMTKSTQKNIQDALEETGLSKEDAKTLSSFLVTSQVVGVEDGAFDNMQTEQITPESITQTAESFYGVPKEQELENILGKEEAKGDEAMFKTESPEYAVGDGSGHTAPIRDDFNAPIYDLGRLYPDDIYTKGVEYYGTGYSKLDSEVMEILAKIRDNPNAEVTIYRAVPKNKDISTINAGDWVSLTKGYAEEHGKSNLGEDYKILSKKVMADEVFTDANSIQEFGYDPRQISTDTQDNTISLTESIRKNENNERNYNKRLREIYPDVDAVILEDIIHDAIALSENNSLNSTYIADRVGEYLDDRGIMFRKEGEKTPEKRISGKQGAERIRQLSERHGVAVTTYIANKIYTGDIKNGRAVRAFGLYLDNSITLAEAITEFTADHEMGHFFLDNIEGIPTFKKSGLTKDAIIAELRKKYNKDGKKFTDKQLEEKLMELVEERAKQIQEGKYLTRKPKNKIEKFIDMVLDTIRDLFGLSKKEWRSIERFLDTMYFGKTNNGKIITFENHGKNSAFMEARFKEFGEELEMVEVDTTQPTVDEQYNSLLNTIALVQKTVSNKKIAWRLKKLDEEIKTISEKIDKAPKEKTRNKLQKRYDLLDEQRANLIIDATEARSGGLKSQLLQLRGMDIDQIIKLGVTKGIKEGEKQERLKGRLYTKTILSELRLKIPRSEWRDFMVRLAQIETSEAKYLQLLSDINERSIKLEIERGDKADRARLRSGIAYLRRVFDLSPSLISSIKKDLNVKDVYKRGEKKGQKKDELKSIKDYSFEELSMFMGELKKRIEFIKTNKVDYLKLSKLAEKKGVFRKIGDFFKFLDSGFIATQERKVQSISNVVYERLMTVFFNKKSMSSRYTELTQPLLDTHKKMSEEDKGLVTQYAQSGQEEQLKNVLKQYATKDEIETMLDNARQVLNEIHKDLNDVGINVPYRNFFFPRKLKPLTNDQIELLIKQFETKMGKKANAEEREKITGNFLRGFDFTSMPFITLSGKRFESHRFIETITSDIVDFYEPFDIALSSYLAGAIDVIETRRYFGKSNTIESLDYESSIEQSIQSKVDEMYGQGIITFKQINELKDTLNTIFNTRQNHAIGDAISTVTYGLTLTQFTSVINQVKDLSMQILLNDVFAGQINTFTSKTLSNADVYLTDTYNELESGNINKIVDNALLPFQKSDSLFLNVFVNSVRKRLQKQAQKSNKRLKKQLDDIFGVKEADNVMKEIADGKITENLRRIIFSEVAKIRPITPLQKSRQAVKTPVFYILKNFMIKQLQFVRSEGIDFVVEGIKKKDPKIAGEGVARIIAIASVIGLLGAGVDELKDWIMGKSEDFSDNVVDNLLQVIGINQYLIQMGKRFGPGETLGLAVSPAPFAVLIQVINEAFKDTKDILSGENILDSRTIKRFPLIGNLYYRRWGGGDN